MNGDGPAALGATLVCEANVSASTPAGVYAGLSACGGAIDPNYSITYAGGTMTVRQAVLSASVQNTSRYYGQANPAFALSAFSGFKNGDTAAVVQGAPTFATTAAPTSAPGSYSVTPSAGTLSATNYSFALSPGTLVIAKAPVTIAAATITNLASALAHKVTFSAKVTNAKVTGSTAAGITVTFLATTVTHYKFGCTAVTNAQGVATCTNANVLATWVTYPPTYTATTAANADYLAGSATGRFRL